MEGRGVNISTLGNSVGRLYNDLRHSVLIPRERWYRISRRPGFQFVGVGIVIFLAFDSFWLYSRLFLDRHRPLATWFPNLVHKYTVEMSNNQRHMTHAPRTSVASTGTDVTLRDFAGIPNIPEAAAEGDEFLGTPAGFDEYKYINSKEQRYHARLWKDESPEANAERMYETAKKYYAKTQTDQF